MKVIDETQDDLRKLIEADFGPLEPNDDFERSLLNWLHYQARRIPQRPRVVLQSQEVRAATDRNPTIRTIARELRAGKDMSPWLHDAIRKQKPDAFADLMFNDWKIVHFHLGGVFLSSQKVQRNGDLLFCYIAANQAIFLDVQPHGSWGMTNLLRILSRTDPTTMARCEIKGVLGTQQQYGDAEYVKLRQAGMATMLTIDGRVYMAPGLGVASSCDATRIVRYMSQLKKSVHNLCRVIPKNELPQSLSSVIYGNLSLPVRLGIVMSAGDMTIYDKNRSLVLTPMPTIE